MLSCLKMPPMTDFLQLSETDYFECKHDFSVPRSSVDVGEYSYISKSRGRCDDKSVRIKKRKEKHTVDFLYLYLNYHRQVIEERLT